MNEDESTRRHKACLNTIGTCKSHNCYCRVCYLQIKKGAVRAKISCNNEKAYVCAGCVKVMAVEMRKYLGTPAIETILDVMSGNEL